MPNWLKVTLGVVVIAGLAVATVATAGTAAGLIVGTALAGATIGGATGAVSGYISDGVDGAATVFLTGTVFGGISGALSASGAGSIVTTIGNAVLNSAEYAAENIIDGTPEDITLIGVTVTAAISVGGDLFDKAITKMFPKVNLGIDLDLDLKNAKDAIEFKDNVIKEFSSRPNDNYAAKQILRADEYLSDKTAAYYGDYIIKEMITAPVDAIKDKSSDIIIDKLNKRIKSTEHSVKTQNNRSK